MFSRSLSAHGFIQLTCLMISVLGLSFTALSQESTPGPAKAVFSADIEKAELSQYWKELNPTALIKEIEADPKVYQPFFMLVLGVANGSPAEAAGVTPSCKVWMFPQHPKAEGKLHWIDREGKYHADPMEPSATDLSITYLTNLTNWYIFHGKRDPKWDATVVAALQYQQKDAKIADSMWARAIELGYPADPFSNLCGMAVAMSRGDIARAEAFAEAHGPLKNTSQVLLYPNAWGQLAALSGNPKWWLYAAEGFESTYKNSDWVKYAKSMATIQVELAKKHAGKINKSPSELAEGMRHVSYLDRADRFGKAFWSMQLRDGLLNGMIDLAHQAEQEKKKEFISFFSTMPLDMFTKGWTGPKIKSENMDVSIKFKVKPLTREGIPKCNFVRELCMGFVNGNSKDQHDYEGLFPPGAQILTISFQHDTYLQMERYQNIQAMLPSIEKVGRCTLHDNPTKPDVHRPSYLMPDQSLDPNKFHTLRMVRVGPQVEAILDGKRLALTYVPDGRNETGFAMFRSGVEVTVKSFTADILK